MKTLLATLGSALLAMSAQAACPTILANVYPPGPDQPKVCSVDATAAGQPPITLVCSMRAAIGGLRPTADACALPVPGVYVVTMSVSTPTGCVGNGPNWACIAGQSVATSAPMTLTLSGAVTPSAVTISVNFQ